MKNTSKGIAAKVLQKMHRHLFVFIFLLECSIQFDAEDLELFDVSSSFSGQDGGGCRFCYPVYNLYYTMYSIHSMYYIRVL